MPTRSASRQASAPEPSVYPVSSNSLLGRTSVGGFYRILEMSWGSPPARRGQCFGEGL